MSVVAIAIVRRAMGNDRLQRRRTACCNLQGVKAAPGYALHAHRAAAPWLRGDPFDDFNAVVLLLLDILIKRPALRVAGTADVDAHARIAVAGIVGETRIIAEPGE